VLDKAKYSAFESTLNSSIVSYRIVSHQSVLVLCAKISSSACYTLTFTDFVCLSILPLTDVIDRQTDCVAAVADWMRSNRLQLNASKTEVLWCASARRQSQLPSDPLAVGSDLVSPVRCVRDLGIFIDADLTMRTQVTQTCAKCFAALRQLRSKHRSVSDDVLQSLVVALVFSRLDYGSATLVGLPKQFIDRLQSVQNAARSGTADLMALLPVRTNPRWRPPPSCKNFKWPYLRNRSYISATAHDLLI